MVLTQSAKRAQGVWGLAPKKKPVKGLDIKINTVYNWLVNVYAGY
jgi:hypothetical protein